MDLIWGKIMKDNSIRSFTLIELLVVVAIIGILASILLPSLGKAREKGIQALCISNLGQNGKAQALFMMDSNDKFMTSNGAEQNYAGRHGTGNSSKAASTRKLNQYLYDNLQNDGDALANLCPNSNGQRLYDLMGNSYAMNHSGSIPNALTKNDSESSSEIEDPVRMVFMYEWSAHHVVYKNGGYDNVWSLPIHGKTGEYVINFVDGHVKAKIKIYPGLFSRPDHTWSNGE